MKTRLFTALICALVSLSSCIHKELDTLTPMANNVEVVFDWQKAPNHNAHSMSLYLFKDGKRSDYHTFRTHTGGTIQAGVGNYDGICLNEDDIYSFVISGHDKYETFKVTTKEQETLSAMGIPTRGIPRADGEAIRMAPARFWGTGLTDINLLYTDEKQTVTLYPEELVCRYTVDILDVQKLGNAEAKFDASLSALAEGVYPGMRSVTEEAVSFSFVLSANKANNRLSSTFYTFGVPTGEAKKHILSLYFILKDGTGKVYNIDVTKQVNEASNPRDVRIVLQGLVLPDTKDDITDSNVSVSGWNTVNINLSAYIPR